MTREPKPYIEELPGLRMQYIPRCDKCHYVGPKLGHKDLAIMLLNRHCESRPHKVNMRSPRRFTV